MRATVITAPERMINAGECGRGFPIRMERSTRNQENHAHRAMRAPMDNASAESHLLRSGSMEKLKAFSTIPPAIKARLVRIHARKVLSFAKTNLGSGSVPMPYIFRGHLVSVNSFGCSSLMVIPLLHLLTVRGYAESRSNEESNEMDSLLRLGTSWNVKQPNMPTESRQLQHF